jgi:hypothetical protein
MEECGREQVQKGHVRVSSSAYIDQKREGERQPAAMAANGHSHYHNHGRCLDSKKLNEKLKRYLMGRVADGAPLHLEEGIEEAGREGTWGGGQARCG